MGSHMHSGIPLPRKFYWCPSRNIGRTIVTSSHRSLMETVISVLVRIILFLLFKPDLVPFVKMTSKSAYTHNPNAMYPVGLTSQNDPTKQDFPARLE